MDGNKKNASLPLPLSKLIGRESELDSLRQLMDTGVRLITLTGPGGVGKTRLALEITRQSAENYTHGAFFISLEALEQPDQVLFTIANGLGVSESGSQSILNDLRESLAETHALLCIDNWEQVIEAAPYLGQLLSACPRLQVIATSREALRLRGEQEFSVDPLGLQTKAAISHSPAVRLFAERAKEANPSFSLDEASLPVVVEICTLLDGLPLAIELAAAMVRMFSPQALLNRLKSRDPKGQSSLMQALASGARDLPARQRTLHSVIDWSYHLLDSDEQQVFRWMSVFSGGFDFEAAEAVCSGAGSTIRSTNDLLISLADKSLLRADSSASQPRFTMLRTIQEYGLGQLEIQGETFKVNQRHASYMLALAEIAEKEWYGPAQLKWIGRFQEEKDNFMNGLSWCIQHNQIETAYKLGGILWRIWFYSGFYSEGTEWYQQILAMPGDVDQGDKAKLFTGLGLLSERQGNIEIARSYFLESLQLRQEINDDARVADSFLNLALLEFESSNDVSALNYIDDAINIYQNYNDRWGLATGLHLKANVHLKRNEYNQAFQFSEQSLEIYRSIGIKYQTGECLTTLGEIAYYQNRYDQASQYFNESRSLFLEYKDIWGISFSNIYLGLIALKQQNYQQAEDALLESLHSIKDSGDKIMTALNLEGLACLAVAKSEMDRAVKLWGAAGAIRALIGSPLSMPQQIDYGQFIKMAAKQLGENHFNRIKAEGEQMNFFEAVLFGLREGTKPKLDNQKNENRRAHPAGLTAREADVLRCVADGLTDQEVADKLFISPRTVNAHLTSVYGKLGVSSRAAATRFAIQNGLAA